MEKNGWINFHRTFAKYDWYKDSKMVHLFLHLVLSASSYDIEWLGISVKRGEAITSRRQIVNETGIADRTIKSCLDRLVKSNMITTSQMGNYIVITICDYEKYAGSEDKTGSEDKK